MPQVHNKRGHNDLDPSGLGKNSRFMATVRFTDGSVKRLKVLNSLQQNLTKLRLNAFNRDADFTLRKHRRARQRMCDSLRKTMAYQIVARNHPIAKAPDYRKALDRRYSFNALKHEIKDMMEQLEPEKVRQRKALALIAENKKRYDEILQKCKRDVNAWPSYAEETNAISDKSQSNDDEDDKKDNKTINKAKHSPVTNQHERDSTPKRAAFGSRKQSVTMEFIRQTSHLSVRVVESDDVDKPETTDSIAEPTTPVTGRKYKLPPLKIPKERKKGVIENSNLAISGQPKPASIKYELPPIKTRHKFEAEQTITAQA